jgi:hypothetical protein
MVNNFLSEKGLQEKFKPKWAECFIHVLNAILLVEVGLNKFFFFGLPAPIGSIQPISCRMIGRDLSGWG